MKSLSEAISANLESWMGKSKAVNDAGKALSLFHGSRSPWVVSFSREKIGSGVTGPDAEKYDSFWFSSNKDTAEFFTDRTPKKAVDLDSSFTYGSVETRYFCACDRNGDTIFSHGPFKTDDEAEEAMEQQINAYNKKLRQNTFLTEVHLRIENPLVLDGIIPRLDEFKRARASDHDGIISRGVVDGYGLSDVYCVFSPSQIKAADNTGLFSKDDPDIRDIAWLPLKTLLLNAESASFEIKKAERKKVVGMDL